MKIVWCYLPSVMLLALAGSPGCAERTTNAAPEWPPPEQVSQSRMDENCIVVDEGLKCWASPGGSASEAELLLLGRDMTHPSPPLPFVDLGVDATVVAVDSAPGTPSRCAVLSGRGVKCWGENKFFSLALPDEEARIGDEASEWGDALAFVDVGQADRVVGLTSRASAGYCVLFEGGGVKCWGEGTSTLGLGETEPRGDASEDMGDALPYVALGSGVKAAGVHGYGGHVCIWTDEGRTKCWGNNDRGQLGHGTTGEPIGDDPGEMGDALPFVDLGRDVFVIQVATGQDHTCALTDEGGVKCWGANSTVGDWMPPDPMPEPSQKGRLGLGDEEDRVAPLGDALPFVDLGSDIRAVAIAADARRTCAVLTDGRMKCWGAVAALYGGDEERGDAPGEMGDALPYVDVGTERSVRAVSLGQYGACVLLDNDSIKCFSDGKTGDALEPVATANDLYGPRD